jgi:hypothetical protein
MQQQSSTTADRPRPEGDHEDQRERLGKASSKEVANDEVASNPWHGVGDRGSVGTAMAVDTKQPDA